MTYRVDPATDRIVATILTARAGRFSHIATGAWFSLGQRSAAAGTGSGDLPHRPQLNRVTAVHPAARQRPPRSSRRRFGSVWATSTAHVGSVLRIDPMTDQVAGQPIQVNASVPGGIVAGSGATLGERRQASMLRLTAIDPATGGHPAGRHCAKVSDVSTTSDGSLWTFGYDSIHRSTRPRAASSHRSRWRGPASCSSTASRSRLRGELATVKPPFDVTSFYWLRWSASIPPPTSPPAARSNWRPASSPHRRA